MARNSAGHGIREVAIAGGGYALRVTGVTVTTSATALPSTPYSQRRMVAIANLGAVTVYVGGSDVTTASGYPIAANGQLSIDLLEFVPIYGIVASGTADVRVMELL